MFRRVREALTAAGVPFSDDLSTCRLEPPKLGRSIELRPYQSAALTAWQLAGQQGTVVLPTGETRRVVARAADPAERDRLWQALVDLGTAAYTHANARQRPRETAIVVLEPSAD